MTNHKDEGVGAGEEVGEANSHSQLSVVED